MIAPSPEGLGASGRAAWAALWEAPIAHRGLWSPERPENSPGAFETACAAGYGVELDVRLSRDGVAVVIHDADLNRMTGTNAAVCDLDAAELTRLTLGRTGERLATLGQALAVIGGRSLVLVELKTAPGAEGPLEAAAAAALASYTGPAALIAFNPGSVAWVAARHPDILRGLNVHQLPDPTETSVHFLLPSVALADDPGLVRHSDLPLVWWTVRDPAQAMGLRARGDNVIFEGFAA